MKRRNLINRLVNGGAMCMVSILSAAAGVMILPMLANAESTGDSLGVGSVEAGMLSGDVNAENTGTAEDAAGAGTDDAMLYSGAEENAQDAKDMIYDFKDNKTTGSVVVEKYWEDNKRNDDRPPESAVNISISTKKPSKSTLGYTITFHGNGLTFADGSDTNEIVYNSSGQIVSGTYKAIGDGTAAWYTDKTCTNKVTFTDAGGLDGLVLSGDMDVWAKEVTFVVKGYTGISTKKYNDFNYAIPDTVTSVIFTDVKMPANATSIDVDADGDGGVVAWTENNGTVMKVSTQIAGVKVEAGRDSRYMFYKQGKLAVINFSNFDTQNVTSMTSMFYECSNLTSLDVSGFDTQNVTNMEHMLFGCKNLTSLDASGFNTQNVMNMSYMFQDCQSLTSLDISGFDTQNVTNIYYMFCRCYKLINLDVSEFNTQNVKYMNSMFENCNSLTSLNVSGFNTQNVTDMSYMFYNCKSLTGLDVSGFDTQNV
ncbi:MAG: BspA family leucine-rich repeat surface protein, partial [Lachnospiraceae bacterium]|nr:BspA family leucine-rich repeat surface protein [Lachnospiraceae bacterium]